MMKRPYEVQNGFCIPIQSPFYRSPFVPHQCTNRRSVSVWVEVKEEMIKKYLAPTPFTYVTNLMNISISDYSNADGFMGYFDCNISFPVKYKDIQGAYTMFAYASEDFAIWSGRDLWGYPREYADIDLVEGVDKVVATAKKFGSEFIRIEFDAHKPAQGEEPTVPLKPDLQLHVVPNCDGPGVFLKRVMMRDTSPDYVGRIHKLGEASLTLRCDGRNPLDEFSDGKIVCATYDCGEFYATEENGWGKVLDVIIKPSK